MPFQLGPERGITVHSFITYSFCKLLLEKSNIFILTKKKSQIILDFYFDKLNFFLN